MTMLSQMTLLPPLGNGMCSTEPDSYALNTSKGRTKPKPLVAILLSQFSLLSIDLSIDFCQDKLLVEERPSHYWTEE